MSVTKELFETSRLVPETNETGWGAEVTGQLCDLLDGADAVLCKDGSSNIYLRLQDASSTLAAAATLTPSRPVHKVGGDGGAVTLNATTAIADGTKDGQVLVLVGTSNTNTVKIIHGANVQLNGNVTLAQHDVLRLVWSDTVGDWVELGRNS